MKIKVLDHHTLLALNESSVRAGRSQNLRPHRIPAEPRERYWINTHTLRERDGLPEVRVCVSEAASLILQAGAVGTGGETFVLDMGESVRIVTLAETMITLSGLKPYEDIDILFTGLRPGEKLSEELHDDEEALKTTEYEKLLMMKSHPPTGILLQVEELLGVLPTLEPEEVKSYLKHLVPEYLPGGSTRG